MSRTVWWVAFAQLALHLVWSTRGYGYFGDELYYLASIQHLDFGYVDHPPFSIWLLAAWSGIFGKSLVAIRVLAAALGAAAVVLAGLLASELGAKARAQLLTAVVFALAPVNLVVSGYYSMNVVDAVVWLLAFVAVARVLRAPSRAGWVGLGVVLGVGLLNKLSILWFGAGLFVGLSLTPHRRLLLTSGPWLTGGIAAALFVPHILWQIAHGWPTAEFVRVATTQKMVPVPAAEVIAQQVLVWNPVVLPLWVWGLGLLIWRPPTSTGRVFAAIYVVTAAILVANGTSRSNYLALAAPPLVAAGALALERATRGERWRWVLPATTGFVACVGLAGSPLTIPILEPEALSQFQAAVGISAPKMEHQHRSTLDQHFADMLGWDDVVASAAAVYRELPPEDQPRTVFLAPSYSTAGAIDVLGPAEGLPHAISGHNSYWLWGPGDADGSVVVILGGEREHWTQYWKTLEEAAVWDCGYCTATRNHQSVFVAREPRQPLPEMWPKLRHYN